MSNIDFIVANKSVGWWVADSTDSVTVYESNGTSYPTNYQSLIDEDESISIFTINFPDFLQERDDPPKLFRYLSESAKADYRSVDLGSPNVHPILHKRPILEDGVRVSTEFYAQATPSPTGPVFDDLVAKVSFVFTRPDGVIAAARTHFPTWISESGVEIRGTPQTKIFTPEEGLEEQKRRRSNIITRIQTVVIGSLMAGGFTQPQAISQAQTLLEAHVNQIELYLGGGDPAILVSSLQSDTLHTWLQAFIQPNVTLRAFILSNLV